MTVQSSPFVPPAPAVPSRDLGLWRLLTRSTLSIWPDYAFERLYVRNRVMGIETVLVSDPEGVHRVLAVNPANYRRPYSVTRVVRPLIGSGLFLAEGTDWRRQRRLLAPTFTPASIGVLLPHFREAGFHLLRSVERSPRAADAAPLARPIPMRGGGSRSSAWRSDAAWLTAAWGQIVTYGTRHPGRSICPRCPRVVQPARKALQTCLRRRRLRGDPLIYPQQPQAQVTARAVVRRGRLGVGHDDRGAFVVAKETSKNNCYYFAGRGCTV
jgi:hypothetical protein